MIDDFGFWILDLRLTIEDFRFFPIKLVQNEQQGANVTMSYCTQFPFYKNANSPILRALIV